VDKASRQRWNRDQIPEMGSLDRLSRIFLPHISAEFAAAVHQAWVTAPSHYKTLHDYIEPIRIEQN
jgi:hypothetical protein